MRLTSSGAYARPRPAPKMPPGLVELMEDLTRNVLRHNPTDIHEFCAGHMEKLLEIRDGRAAPKPVLTLEQKIARAQEKLHKKAELRRQKYDKQMQLYRLNTKLEQSPEQKDQIAPSNIVENISTNSFETQSNEVADAAKEIVTDNPVDNTTHSNIAEDIPEDQKITMKNNDEKTFADKDSVEDPERESAETNIVQDHVNIVPEDKDSIEKQIEKDIGIQNKSEDSATDDIMQRKTDYLAEMENKPNDLTESPVEQDIEMHMKEEESAPSNIKEDKVGDQINEKQLVKDIEIENGTEGSVAAAVQDETSNISVAKSNSEDSTKATQQDVTEIKKEEGSIGENLEADKTDFTNTVEDKSKGPIHHEQDLVEDLEVEIFHEPSETKKENKKDSSDTQPMKDEVKHNLTGKESSNIESDASKLEMANGEGSEESKENQDINSFVKHNTDTESSDNLKLEFCSQEDKSNASDENVSENTNTSINNSAIDNSNNTINLDISVPETVNVDSESSAIVHENNTQINEVTERSSQYKTESIITEISGVDNEELDEKMESMSEIVDQCVKEKINDSLENIKNHVDVKDNIDKEHFLNINGKPIDGGVFEMPMQKKEYALLLPEVDSDNKTEPIASEHKNGQLKHETQENIAIYAKSESFIDKSILDNSDQSKNISANKEAVETASDIKQAVIQAQESCEDISEPVEINENVTDDDIKSKLIDDVCDDTEVKECNANSKDEDQELGKESLNKQTEMNTPTGEIEISNNNNKLEEVTTKQDDRSGNEGDAEENVSVNSEHTQNTETQVLNDSADNSTVGDSNDSLMDHDVETVTRSKSPSTMDLETAAVTIQKVFRTFLFKSRCSTFDDTSNDEANPTTDDDDNEKEEVEFPIAKERRALGISRMDTVLQTVNEEKSLSLSTDDSSTLSSAATVIQAHVRGYLARNKFHSHKTTFSTSLVDAPSTHSLEADDQQKKTVLNIHIVPEGDHFLSRDESILTSMDLSLDGSPPTSINLHPLGYDKSEPRKQLKREDAIQSISPPSNNSGKLSEDVDSVKDIVINETGDTNVARADTDVDSDTSPTKSTTLETVVEMVKGVEELSVSLETEQRLKDPQCKRQLTKMSSDESDVVTPFEQDKQSTDSDNTSRLLHSGEFHDMVLPTNVSRGDTSVVRGE